WWRATAWAFCDARCSASSAGRSGGWSSSSMSAGATSNTKPASRSNCRRRGEALARIRRGGGGAGAGNAVLRARLLVVRCLLGGLLGLRGLLVGSARVLRGILGRILRGVLGRILRGVLRRVGRGGGCRPRAGVGL